MAAHDSISPSSPSSGGAAAPSRPQKHRPAPMDELRDEDAILNFIFDPNRAFIGAAAMPSREETEAAAQTLPEDSDPAIVECRALEKDAVAAAEKDDLDHALELLAKAEGLAPQRGSVYNNRAQVYRLKKDNLTALNQLNRAIEIESAWIQEHLTSAAQTSTFAAHRKVLQNAHTQRAIVHHALGNSEAEKEDMQQAAHHGSALARMLASDVNPYATLCHVAVDRMMQDAFGKPKPTTSSAPAATDTSPAPSSPLASSAVSGDK